VVLVWLRWDARVAAIAGYCCRCCRLSWWLAAELETNDATGGSREVNSQRLAGV